MIEKMPNVLISLLSIALVCEIRLYHRSAGYTFFLALLNNSFAFACTYSVLHARLVYKSFAAPRAAVRVIMLLVTDLTLLSTTGGL